MNINKEIYEFASSAGALEGFVYLKEELAPGIVDNWVKNLLKQYQEMPADALESFQSSLDRTLGRAVQSLRPLLGEDHAHVQALMSMIVGKLPESAVDFSKEKEEKASKYGQ